MMSSDGYKKIQGEDLRDFLNNLTEEYTVYAPVENKGPIKTDEEFIFGEIESAEEAALHHPPSMIPPKRFFFPEKETMLEIEDSKVKEPKLDEELVLFGVHDYDINSFLILDKMFAQDPHSDPYYERRRENSIVIGIDYEPTEYCFSKSMGKEKAEEGFDLHLTKVPEDDAYIVLVGSETGAELASSDLFKSVDSEVARDVIERSLDWEEEVSVDTEGLPEMAYESFGDEELWEEFGEKCLGCGNCTMVCPCCNCFDVKDEASLESLKVSRKKTWNACTLLEFAEVSGGNFRSSIKSRYRNWFFDKFRIFPKEIEEFGCVGCGRCIKACPVDIDVREVISEVREKHGG